MTHVVHIITPAYSTCSLASILHFRALHCRQIYLPTLLRSSGHRSTLSAQLRHTDRSPAPPPRDPFPDPHREHHDPENDARGGQDADDVPGDNAVGVQLRVQEAVRVEARGRFVQVGEREVERQEDDDAEEVERARDRRGGEEDGEEWWKGVQGVDG